MKTHTLALVLSVGFFLLPSVALANKTVTVNFGGTGNGSVTSSLGGITCYSVGGSATGDCSESYSNSATVTLTATASSTVAIGAWNVATYTINSGCTSGNTTCNFTMDNSAQTVSVTLTKTDTTPPSSSVISLVTAIAGFASSSPLSVNWSASDASGVASTSLFYRFGGSGSYSKFGSSQSGTSGAFSFTFPSGDGLYEFYTISSDIALNTESAPGSADQSVTLDTAPPSVALTTSLSDPTNTSPIPVTATFSEAVAGFDATDINTSGTGVVGNFSGSGAVYTFDVTPNAEGPVTVDVSSGVASDAAGNGNSAASQLSVSYASTSPSIAVTTPGADGSVFGASSLDVYFSATPSPTGAAIDHIECSIDGGATTTACTSPQSLSALSDGEHRFLAHAVDAAGNTSDLVRTFGIDTQGPTADALSVTTDEDTATSSTVTASDSYIPGSLTFGVVSGPSSGTLLFNSDGTFTYTPSANFNGSDSFTFEANDGFASSSAPATVLITVNPVNDPPLLDAISNQSVTVGSTVTFTASSTDPEGSPVVYELSGAPAGASIDAGTGAFSWNTTGASTGDFTFSVNAGDGEATSSVSVTISVNAAPSSSAGSGGGGGQPVGSSPTAPGGANAVIPTAPSGGTGSTGGSGSIIGTGEVLGAQTQTSGTGSTGGSAGSGGSGTLTGSASAGTGEVAEATSTEQGTTTATVNGQTAAAGSTGTTLPAWIWALLALIIAAGLGWQAWTYFKKPGA